MNEPTLENMGVAQGNNGPIQTFSADCRTGVCSPYEERALEVIGMSKDEKDLDKRNFLKSYLRGVKFRYDKKTPEPAINPSLFSYFGYGLGRSISERIDLNDAYIKLKKVIDSLG